MSDSTKIEWADSTWSPWEGCTKVGPGCDHCYAEAMNRWLRKGENWGPGAPRRLYSEAHWHKPIVWNAAGKRSVFPSVCDPFDNEAPDGQRERFWQLIEATPNLTWLLLTKRIGNVAGMVPMEWMWPGNWPDNVWLGATVVNQEEADRDVSKLLAIYARVRFLSCEPLLGPIDLQQAHIARERLRRVDWVIVGGESGREARPMHPDWARSIRDQCANVGVPFLFKQWGEFAPNDRTFTQIEESGRPCVTVSLHADGSLPAACMDRVGKKVAGRELDGRTWDEFPA